MNTTPLSTLRAALTKNAIVAVIIPSTDPHGSEYIAPHWQARDYFSGFTGSAGTLVVAADMAALWTDSRYFLQAEEQLRDSGIALMKEGQADTPSITEWLAANVERGGTVSIEASLFSVAKVEALQIALEKKGLRLETGIDLAAEAWSERPALPSGEVRVLDVSYCGRSTKNKLEDVRAFMSEAHIDALLLTALDEIAWLMNIRGTDIAYNPVVIAYCVVYQESALLFVDAQKLSDETAAYLSSQGVTMKDYDAIFLHLTNLHPDFRIGIDRTQANYALYRAIQNYSVKLSVASPIALMKGVKNSTELAGFRRAMIKDGVALVRFFRWFEKRLKAGDVTELEASRMLHDCRAEQEGYVSESFETIAATGAHGAIVHYEPTEESDAVIERGSFFLLDSGGQYLDGTTDITRTVAVGALSKQQKRDYTLVLKGHIALSQARFPKNTRGVQLDVLARQFLWNDALQFGHGTGHGVGHFLCVHEGPHSIRMNENPTTLQPGMVVSNEPGLYRSGAYGIRIENLIAVQLSTVSEFGTFYQFETLTLFPYDTKAMDTKLLTGDEIDFINRYHKLVYKRLAPYLTEKEQSWLEKRTKAI